MLDILVAGRTQETRCRSRLRPLLKLFQVAVGGGEFIEVGIPRRVTGKMPVRGRGMPWLALILPPLGVAVAEAFLFLVDELVEVHGSKRNVVAFLR